MSCHCHEHSCKHTHIKGKKLLILRLILGSCLFAAGLITKINIFLFIAYIVLGYDVLYEAVKDIKNIFNENFLMSIATIGAFIIAEYSEAVAVMLFYQIGEALSDYAVDKSKNSITALMDLRSDTAKVLINGKYIELPCEDIKVGEIIFVSAGEKVPLDGVITEGSAYFNTSALTGESKPLLKKENDEIMSGMININSAVKIKVTKIFTDSTVSKILELVNSENKADSEKFITKFAKIYTPIVVITSLIIAAIPPIFTGNFSDWIYIALLFLVVSCPCALVVSVPLTFFAGIGCASKNGILIKGGYALECLAKTRNIAFDKTGTLTEGKFKVQEIRVNGIKQELLEYAAYAEFYSPHPIGAAIVAAYGKEIDTSRISEYKEIAGFGIISTIDDKKILIGNQGLMKANDIICPPDTKDCVFVAIDNRLFGSITVKDRLKNNAKETISDLSVLGITSQILTGDNKENAQPIANELNITYNYGLLPQDKVSVLNEIKKSGTTAFVGDGINDTPVLSHADVGISMGSIGTDAAIEASDIVIMTDNLEKIPLAIRIARKTLKIATENIWLALGIKFIIMFLSLLHLSTMWLAVFADVGVCLLAILNALRSFRIKGEL